MKIHLILLLSAGAFKVAEAFVAPGGRVRGATRPTALFGSKLNYKDEKHVDVDVSADTKATKVAPKKEEPEPEAETPQIPFRALATRTVDTIEDVLLHIRRKPYDLGWAKALKDGKEDTRQTIVVLGSGWAAHALLKVANTYKLRVIVVSPTNHFVFTPMLTSAAVGTVEYRSITEPIRSANPMLDEYIQGKAIDVDVDNKVLKVQEVDLLDNIHDEDAPVFDIPYDKLVVSVGCKVADHFVAGAKEHALKLKTCDDARKLRNAIQQCLEYASRFDVSERSFNELSKDEQEKRREERRNRATFVIVGAGPTGVECAGELRDLFDDVTKENGPYEKLKDDLRLVLIDGGGKVVQMFNPEMSQYAEQQLKREGVDVRLNTFVKEIGDGYVKIFPKGGDKDKDEEMIRNGLTIWAAGVGAVPFTEKLLDQLPEEARAPQGRIKVDKWLRPPTKNPDVYGSILVLGDAASFEDDDGNILPQNAQVAGQHGAFTARMLNRGYDLAQTTPVVPDDDESPCAVWARTRGLKEADGFDFLNLGLLAYLGRGESLTQVELGDVPVYDGAGKLPFILWRTVYLVKQVATRNRVLVNFDWLKAKVFGRDITQL